MIIHFKNESTLTVAGIKKQFIVKLIKKVAKETIVIHVKHNQPEQSQNFRDALVRWKVVTIIQLIRNNANQFLGKTRNNANQFLGKTRNNANQFLGKNKKQCQPVPRKNKKQCQPIPWKNKKQCQQFLGKNKKQYGPFS